MVFNRFWDRSLETATQQVTLYVKLAEDVPGAVFETCVKKALELTKFRPTVTAYHPQENAAAFTQFSYEVDHTDMYDLLSQHPAGLYETYMTPHDLEILNNLGESKLLLSSRASPTEPVPDSKLKKMDVLIKENEATLSSTVTAYRVQLAKAVERNPQQNTLMGNIPARLVRPLTD